MHVFAVRFHSKTSGSGSIEMDMTIPMVGVRYVQVGSLEMPLVPKFLRCCNSWSLGQALVGRGTGEQGAQQDQQYEVRPVRDGTLSWVLIKYC